MVSPVNPWFPEPRKPLTTVHPAPTSNEPAFEVSSPRLNTSAQYVPIGYRTLVNGMEFIWDGHQFRNAELVSMLEEDERKRMRSLLKFGALLVAATLIVIYVLGFESMTYDARNQWKLAGRIAVLVFIARSMKFFGNSAESRIERIDRKLRKQLGIT